MRPALKQIGILFNGYGEGELFIYRKCTQMRHANKIKVTTFLYFFLK